MPSFCQGFLVQINSYMALLGQSPHQHLAGKLWRGSQGLEVEEGDNIC